MSVASLWHVTETLRTLLLRNLAQLLGAARTYTVTTQPPESLDGKTLTVNLFLYHVAEDPTYKNQPIPGAGRRGVARTPMALVLYYIVTAHHEVNDEFDAATEQELMGGVLKTFHDFPTIESSTAIAGTRIMEQTMAETGQNWLDVTLRPLTPEEAIHFWSSEQRQTTRLSAYYEVRAVFLTPEEPTTYHGTVLRVGSYVSLMNAPVLNGSSSNVRFEPPASAMLGSQTVSASPARVFLLAPPDNTASSPATFTLTGSNLLAGEAQRLILRHPDFTQLPQPMRDIELDPATNAMHGWDVRFGSRAIDVRFGSSLSFTDHLGNVRTISLNPGTYMLAVESVVARYEAGASSRPMTERSNFLPLTVGPLVKDAFPPDPNSVDEALQRRFVLTLSPAFDIARNNDDSVERLDVRLVLDGVSYQRVIDDSELLQNGQFYVVATPATAAGPAGSTLYDTVEVVLRSHFDPGVAGEHAVRLIVEGIDSSPFWLEVP